MWCQNTRRAGNILSSLRRLQYSVSILGQHDEQKHFTLQYYKSQTKYNHYQCVIGNYNQKLCVNGQSCVDLLQRNHVLNQSNCMYTTTSKVPICVYTDASGKHGFGCVWGKEWVAGYWNDKCLPKYETNTVYLEAYSILIALRVWCHSWANCTVSVYCDQTSVVDGFNTKCKIKNPETVKLFETISDLTRKHNIQLNVIGLTQEGKKSNFHKAADALSKGKMDRMREILPDANTMATDVPLGLDMVQYDPS